MSYVKKIITTLILAFFYFHCSNPNGFSNLFPDDTDKRDANSSALLVGDKVSDFTLYDTSGNSETLSTILAQKNGLVIYFTMWCSFCDMHIQNIEKNIKPNYPDIEFYLLDYVSATTAEAYENQSAGGYLDFKTALDQNSELTDLFKGTMGTTIIINKKSVLRFNEDFKDGQRAEDILIYINE